MLRWIALIVTALAAAGQTASVPAAAAVSNTNTATESKPAESKAPDPLDRTSPQSSVLAFLDSCRAKDYQRAVHYLELSNVPAADRMTRGVQLAQQLEQILNRDAQFDVASLSREPLGDLQDGLPPNRDLLAAISTEGKAVQIELERKDLRSGIPVWRVASDSLALIPGLAAATSESSIERHLPAPLVNYKLLDTSAWRWLALVALAIVIASLSRSLTRLILAVLKPLLSRIRPSLNWDSLTSFVGPVQLLLCAAAFGAGFAWIDPSAELRLYLRRSVALLTVLGIVWLSAKILDFGVVRLRTALDGSVTRSALPLASRVLKVVILVLAVATVLSSWGYNTTTLLAGLGLGGVALALAAQKTIENLFGSVAVVSDRPVVVGDVCKFGDSMGTVEDIGLRSTRIRTVDRTVVTVPNGDFSSMKIENLSRKDKMLFHFTLNLRRDTTPGQVRKLLGDIEEILKDPLIERGTIPVRFIGVGEYSLNVEIFVYIRTENGDEFLKVQQELLLRILDAVVAAGTALALPTQASVAYAHPQPQAEPVPTGGNGSKP